MKKPFLTETKILVIAIIMILPIYHQVRLDWIMSGGGGLAAYTLAILVGSFVYMMWSAYGADIYDKKKDFLKSIRNPIIVFLVFPFFGLFIVMLSAGVYAFFDKIFFVLIKKIF